MGSVGCTRAARGGAERDGSPVVGAREQVMSERSSRPQVHLSLLDTSITRVEQGADDRAAHTPSVTTLNDDPLEVLRTSVDTEQVDAASQWLEANFEPWMLDTFAHRLYEGGAESIMRRPAAFLSTREDICVEARLAAALITSAIEPAPQASLDEASAQPVWMSALRGAMRAEARKAIVRNPEPGCDNILKFWNQLSEPDRRWAVGRLGAFDLYRRCELVYLGLVDRSEAVVIEALCAVEQASSVGTCGKIGAALQGLKTHASLHVRAKLTRSRLIQYQWPQALILEENSRVRRLLVRRAFEDLSGRALQLCLRHADSMTPETIESVLYHASLEADTSREDLAFLCQHPLEAVRAATERFFPSSEDDSSPRS